MEQVERERERRNRGRRSLLVELKLFQRMKTTNYTHRITARCSVFSPSRLTSWMGPSGRRASVLETCIEVNIVAEIEMRSKQAVSLSQMRASSSPSAHKAAPPLFSSFPGEELEIRVPSLPGACVCVYIEDVEEARTEKKRDRFNPFLREKRK